MNGSGRFSAQTWGIHVCYDYLSLNRSLDRPLAHSPLRREEREEEDKDWKRGGLCIFCLGQ